MVIKKSLLNQTNVNISFWEKKIFLPSYDLVVIGGGIVGLFAAIHFKKRNKKAKVLVLEKGILPHGASTKNAGFACFGSPSELMDDLKKMPEALVWQTLQMRWNGLKLLRKTLGDKKIDYKPYGGYEVFRNKEEYQESVTFLKELNKMTFDAIGVKNCYRVAGSAVRRFGFEGISGALLNKEEGQIDTGLMMQNLMKLAQHHDIVFLNGIQVTKLEDSLDVVSLQSNWTTIRALKVIVATNGFASELLQINDVVPARAQVLITKPIKGLKLKGTFHYQQGYYYFRNIENRVLFGGGRNLDFKGEQTTDFAVTLRIQQELETILKEIILPSTPFEIDHRWAGIMGVGQQKKPIIRQVSRNVVAAVRMGGMGVAIGSLVGKEASEMIQG
jgi:gamma-glutamylputrescine oxidase